MKPITATTEEGQRLTAQAEWVVTKAAVLVAEIEADLTALDSAPTNALVIAIVRRDLVRQRKMINGLVRLIRNGL